MEKNKLIPKGKEQEGATITGWHSFGKGYDSQKIANIEDKMGASADRNITSVPSPLAQLHVYNTAFEFINTNRGDASKQKGTIFHKLVSHCLDVWEILYSYNQHNGLDFKVWDKDISITKLQNSTHSGHKLLGDTLNLYLNNSRNHKIKAIDKIYLITYKGIVFAGSSPMTGFFVSPDKVDVPFKNSSNVQFFTEIIPLSQRDKAFQMFMAKLMHSHKGKIDHFFSELFDYVDHELRNISPFKQEILQEVFNDVNYTKSQFDAEFNQVVENSQEQALSMRYQDGGISFDFSIPSQKITISNDCQFIIKPTKKLQGDITEYPLIFQNKNNEGTYLKGQAFLSDFEVPIDIIDDEGRVIPLKDRKLPIHGVKHPFITSGDFLEEYLIETDFPINDKKFVTGKIKGFDNENPFKYLLPIKAEYFNYFTISDLENQLTISRNNYGVEVRLEIPVNKSGTNTTVILKRNYKEFQEYIPTENQIHSEDSNQGGTKGVGHIIAPSFNLSLYPNIKVNPESEDKPSRYNDYYKIGLMSMAKRDDYLYELEIKLMRILNESIPLSTTYTNVNAEKVDRVLSKISYNSNYYLAQEEFDFIQLNITAAPLYNTNGLIIPVWERKSIGQKVFSYAVDFGTSNSYVAMRENRGNATSFNIKENEIQLIRLDKPKDLNMVSTSKTLTDKYENTVEYEGGNTVTTTMTELQREQNIPTVLGIEPEGYNMPFQTAVATSKHITSAIEINHGSANIPFAFGKHLHSKERVEMHTNIKWEYPKTHSPELARMQIFFEDLLYMIRNKTILNGGDPAKINFIWFKPISMSYTQLSFFKQIWVSSVNKILGTNSLFDITESEAPFYFFKASGEIDGDEPVLSIDIGGGTTDVLVFDGKAPKYCTSSLMASRVIFGEFKAEAFNKNNPIVNYYKDRIIKTIEDYKTKDSNVSNEMSSLLKWYFDSNVNVRSEDIIGFYFSRSELDFAGMLKEEKAPFKISFLFYFAALHYNCANYLKNLGMKPPRNICMSGNGSKMMYILDSFPSKTSSPLSTLITEIYRSVMGKDFSHQIKIHTTPQPKEATAQGGLWKEKERMKEKAEEKVLAGEKLYDAEGNEANLTDTNIKYKDVYGTASRYSFKAENSNYFDLVDKFVGEWNDKINYREFFGVNADLDKVKEILRDEDLVKSDFYTALGNRLELYGSKPEEGLSETLFFYPVMGAIERLSKAMKQEAEGK